MLRVLFFVLIVFALGFGFAWLADVPGEVVLTVANQEITISLMVAAIGIVASIVIVMFVWWVLKLLLTSPERVQRFFRSRKRDRGYQSLSTGMIAAGAGDGATARKMLKRADGLLDSTTEPLLHLLDAQAMMLEGRHDDARKKFEEMLEDPETRVLGLRGLYVEAQRLGERDAQRHYAEKAVEIAPQLGWASNAALDLKTADGDWDGAIRLLDKQKSAKQVSKEDAARKRAVLLTAMAMDFAETDPAKAKSAGLEAHKLAPEFAPAAVAAAEAAFRLNEVRRGVKILETTWRKEPHPQVGLAYVNAKSGESTADRLKRAKRLEQIKPSHVETNMVVGQMAMEAGEFEMARRAVADVLKEDPRESAFVLMADIEDAETGDQGKVREWMARAVRAPRDAAWTADGYVSQKWAPFSPLTGKIDAFEWKVPVETVGAKMIENDLDPMEPGKAPETLIAEVAATGAVIAGVTSAEKEEALDAEAEKVDVEPAPVSTAAKNNSGKDEKPSDLSSKKDEPPMPPEVTGDDSEEEIKVPIPDDPGVDPNEKPEEDRRFRLF
ncbi:heme biosynthesis protein HemY [Ahrensia marina]|uniref:Heme biosynthesis protein HemY n=1 Tax=Ahrensia marina TaxID=1514904 RepID=A0A0N0VLC9_9HYPH|nr:heme biosynthesis protein HemY [Ahrensia marina]KPB00004.1 heme biosynthesis protein HemY [Ahrensia marina]